MMIKKHKAFIFCLTLAASLIVPPQTNLRAAGTSSQFSDPLYLASHSKHTSKKELSTNDILNSAEQMMPTEGELATGDKYLIAEGHASFYAKKFHGRKTANGEHFNKQEYTAAHRSLPFGTKVLVTNLSNGREVVVRINDRGPHMKSRIIDISPAAAKQIGLASSGIAKVRIETAN
jgi:rare lipoprotein A (peptidoglycan hydrolase)